MSSIYSGFKSFNVLKISIVRTCKVFVSLNFLICLRLRSLIVILLDYLLLKNAKRAVEQCTTKRAVAKIDIRNLFCMAAKS